MSQDSIPLLAERMVNQVDGTPTLQFIRAGRCRWGTGLPSAGSGPTEQNLSKTGSIIEYPQIPADGKPFVLYRGVHYNQETLRNSLEDISHPISSEINAGDSQHSVDTILTALDILNTTDVDSPLIVAEIVPVLELAEVVEDTVLDNPFDDVFGEIEDDEVSNIGRYPGGGILLNKQEGGYHTSSVMNIFESQYIVNENDSHAEQGLYRMANLVGMNWDATYGSHIGAGYYRKLHRKLRKSWEREALLDFIKRCPDNMTLEFNGRGTRSYLEAKMGTEEITIDLESFKDSEAIKKLLKVVMGHDFRYYQDTVYSDGVPIEGAFMFDFLSYYFQPDLFRYGEVKIVNGEYNLESLYGWIEPEYRTQVLNYDSRGRFNDRYSAFMLDWVFVLADRDITSYGTEEDDVEIISVPTWRLSFERSDLDKVLKNILTNPTLNYHDIVECFGILIRAVNDESCIIFPQENHLDPQRGLRGITNSMPQNLLCFDGGNMNRFNKTYFPLKYAFENKQFLFMLGILISKYQLGLTGRGLEYFNYQTTLTAQFKSMIWGDTGNESGDILIGMLLSLDGNLNPDRGYVQVCPNCTQEIATVALDADGNWGCNACEYIDENYVKPWRAFKRDLNKFFGGKSIYNRYVSELAPYFETFASNMGGTKITDSQMREISQYLFTAMVEGYVEHINTNSMNLSYRNFILMFRLLNFQNEGNDGTQYLHPAQRGILETLRDNNLPLYVQASRTFSIREEEGEVFIE